MSLPFEAADASRSCCTLPTTLESDADPAPQSACSAAASMALSPRTQTVLQGLESGDPRYSFPPYPAAADAAEEARALREQNEALAAQVHRLSVALQGGRQVADGAEGAQRPWLRDGLFLAPLCALYILIPTLLGIFVDKEPLTKRKGFGIVLATLAILLLSFEEQEAGSTGQEARSREQGAGREQGARDRAQEAASTDQEIGDEEPSARSREQGAGSTLEDRA